MGAITSRRSGGVEEVDIGASNAYRYPPKSGKGCCFSEWQMCRRSSTRILVFARWGWCPQLQWSKCSPSGLCCLQHATLEITSSWVVRGSTQHNRRCTCSVKIKIWTSWATDPCRFVSVVLWSEMDFFQRPKNRIHPVLRHVDSLVAVSVPCSTVQWTNQNFEESDQHQKGFSEVCKARTRLNRPVRNKTTWKSPLFGKNKIALQSLCTCAFLFLPETDITEYEHDLFLHWCRVQEEAEADKVNQSESEDKADPTHYNIEFTFDSDVRVAITIYYFATEEITGGQVVCVFFVH